MNNKDIIRAMCKQIPVYTVDQQYKKVVEYCIAADDTGSVKFEAGCIDPEGVLRYVSSDSLQCDTDLGKKLPKIEWNGKVSVEAALDAMKKSLPVSDGKFDYDRIKSIKIRSTIRYPQPFYSVVLEKRASNHTMTIDPLSLIIPKEGAA